MAPAGPGRTGGKATPPACWRKPDRIRYRSPMTSARSARHGGVARVFRYLYRVPLLLVHIVVFLPLILLLMLPPFGRIGAPADPLEHRVVRWWSTAFMWIFGFRLQRYGEPLPGAVLLVANHEIGRASCRA